MREALLALALLAVGCADPCAELGDPTLELGSASDDGTGFVPFEDGAALNLVSGPQIGMHVWLSLRLSGFCMPDVEIDRRVVDDETEALIEIQRGPLRFEEDVEPDTWVSARPVTMILCPTERPIVGEPLRFAVRAEDSLGRVDIAMRPFVPVCPTGACDICNPP